MPSPQNIPVALAEPSKSFFIDMLTKDISLSVCILDLIDNSIHGLIAQKNLDVSEHLIAGTRAQRMKGRIEVFFDGSSFSVTDDCGGIPIKEAEEHVFLFGNPVANKTRTGLGVYGIGMKRAFFKMGTTIDFKSHTRTEELRIEIDVDDWKAKREWNFPFTYARPKTSRTGGTAIAISDLHATVKDLFKSKAFKSTLVDKISRSYGLFLKAGLRIAVNGETATANIPELAETKGLRTVRHVMKKDGVEILILAGLSPRTDRTPRGWYVFCNGRMVLDANKDESTGWGLDSRPGFHYKYNHFLGYVYFRSHDLRNLPWATTKDRVDYESPIYQAAVKEMWVLGRPILDFLNNLYGDVREESEPERNLFAAAKAVQLQRVASRKNTIFEATVKKESDDAQVSIQYKRPKKKLKQVREATGRPTLSASRIGEYTFDWFYDRNCK